MLVIVIDKNGKEGVITLPENADFAALRKACAAEFSISESTIHLDYAGEGLNKDLPLSAQIADGATLTLTQVCQETPFLFPSPLIASLLLSVSLSIYLSIFILFLPPHPSLSLSLFLTNLHTAFLLISSLISSHLCRLRESSF